MTLRSEDNAAGKVPSDDTRLAKAVLCLEPLDRLFEFIVHSKQRACEPFGPDDPYLPFRIEADPSLAGLPKMLDSVAANKVSSYDCRCIWQSDTILRLYDV